MFGPLAIAPGNRLYVDMWRRFAVRTGHFVVFDSAGAVETAWPEVDGRVDAIAPDGAGGWFIGGDFAHVGGQRRARLAHMAAGGALDGAWAPAAEGAVRALAVVGATVYAGGEFTSINGQPRSRLAALDRVSGRLLPGTPEVDGSVQALAAVDGVIYVGGEFARVGGADRHGLAAFGAAGGALTAWNPQAGVQTDVESRVEALVVDGGTLYVAGAFTTMGEQPRHALAAFELATGALTAWDPQANYETTDIGTGPGTNVNALVVVGDTVFVGGIFNRIGAARRASLAAVDAHTGQARPWRADVEGFAVQSLAVVGDRLFVGGGIFDSTGVSHANLASVSATTSEWLTWNPRPNDAISAMAVAAGSLAVGGDFYGLGSESQRDLGAIDLATSTPLPFRARIPGIGGDYVFLAALAAQGDTLFAAGYCDPENPCRRSGYLARFDTRTGTVRRWSALAGKSGMYYTLAAHGRRLYVGGRFRTIGGRRRANLAAVDTRTGRVARWRADTDGDVDILLVHGHTLYLAGEFDRVNGHRRYGIAAIDLRSGRLTAWNPNLRRCCGPDAMVVAASASTSAESSGAGPTAGATSSRRTGPTAGWCAGTRVRTVP